MFALILTSTFWHSSFAVELDRRFVLKGFGGMVAAPRVPIAPAVAPAVDDFGSHIDADLVALVRYLQRNATAATPVASELAAYERAVASQLPLSPWLGGAKPVDRSAPDARAAANALQLAARRAGLAGPDELARDVAAEVLDVEDRVAKHFGMTTESYLRATALFREPLRVFFLTPEHAPKYIYAVSR